MTPEAPQIQGEPPRMDRRAAIRWMMTAAASGAFASNTSWGQSAQPGPPASPASTAPVVAPVTPPSPPPREDPLALDEGGYGQDPDLQKEYRAGELWPLTFTPAQRRTVAVLADLIIPADEHSPSASSVGVVDFIDEWISAPYRPQRKDRKLVLAGLLWIDAEANLRFGRPFADLTVAEQTQIADDICYTYDASAVHLEGARFFSLFRDLTAGGFYTTPQGWKDVRYVGNVPLLTFPGPPESVLRKLGIV